jgi:hypothetical protein
VALLTSSTALARTPPPPRLELDWDAPQECPDREAARGAIEAALGTKTETDDMPGPAVVRVKVTQSESGRYAADIWMYDATGSGERSFEGADCAQVTQAAALIVAFALKDQDTDAATKRAQPAADHGAAASAAPADDHPNLALGARVAGDVGSLPQADAGLALVLEVWHGRLSAELAGSAWLPRTTSTGPLPPGSGGEFTLYTGAVRGCFALTSDVSRTWNLGPCAGAEAGMIAGSGVGTSISPQHSAHGFWGAGLFGFSLRYLGALPLVFGILTELGVPIHRAEWQVDDLGRVFQPSVVVGRASLGMSWQFL